MDEHALTLLLLNLLENAVAHAPETAATTDATESTETTETTEES